MQRDWTIKIWGVRGSVPRTEKDFLKFGGNTVCTSIEYGDERIILDAGSGLSVLGRSPGPGPQRISILLGHLHIDHLMGLFSFPPFFDPQAEIHIYAKAGSFHKLETLLGPPFWPVGLSDFPAQIHLHELWADERFSLHGLECHTMAGNHPGGSLLYRLDDGEKSLTYALDCEADETIFPALAEFSRNTGLLIWDAGFAPEDLRPGWGHSTWEQGIRLHRESRAQMVLMSHHNQNYSDSFLHAQEALAIQKDSACLFAKEGMVIPL